MRFRRSAAGVWLVGRPAAYALVGGGGFVDRHAGHGGSGGCKFLSHADHGSSCQRVRSRGFHPEAARLVHRHSGAQRGSAMGIFTVGGNAGFTRSNFNDGVADLVGAEGNVCCLPWLSLTCLQFGRRPEAASSARNSGQHRKLRETMTGRHF